MQSHDEKARASGIRPHYIAPRDGDHLALEAILAVSDALRGGRSLSESFLEIVEIIRRVFPAEQILIRGENDAFVPLVYSDANGAGSDGEARAEAIVEAARRCSDGLLSPEGYDEVLRDPEKRWICLPITTDDRLRVGFLAVCGVASDVDERALAFVALLARHLGKKLATEEHWAIDSSAAAARALASERERVLAMVSHDLMNPLSVILSSAARLLDSSPTIERRQVETIQRNASRMNRLVSDLLDDVAIEAGRLSVRPEKRRPADLVAEAVADTITNAAAAKLALRTEVPPGLPEVWADSDRIVQVFTNVITNAIKFTPADGSIVVRASLEGEHEVAFSVTDTGRGIAPDEVERVFERYWQARPGRAPGAGLGLAICKSLVELSGGRIAVASRLGEGTRVTITLPVTPG